jgi:hypothetical protein
MTSKRLFESIEFKADGSGEFVAVFASRLVAPGATITAADVDKDGDVTLKGAFTNGAPVIISAYEHGSWNGALPVGKGTIAEEGDKAVVRGRFFTDTAAGADTYRVVKSLEEDGLQEWSYSLHDVKASRATVDGRTVRVLESIRVKEVSPVVIGAGIDTGTVSVKSSTKQLTGNIRRLLTAAGRQRWDYNAWLDDFDADEGYAVFQVWDPTDGDRLVRVDFDRTETEATLGDTETVVVGAAVYLPKSQRFAAHAADVLAEVRALTKRASDVMALRAEKGKALAAEPANLLAQIEDELTRLKAFTASAEPPAEDLKTAFDAEVLRFIESELPAA